MVSQLQTEDQRSKRLEVIPIKYDYQRGVTLFLSAREKLVCDVFLRTRNLHECCRQVMLAYGGKLSVRGIKKWMMLKSNIMDYLNKRMGELADWNMTKEEYFARLRCYAEGMDQASRDQQFFWKLMGQAKGWLDSGMNGGQTAIQINFTQGNGEA